MLHTWAGEDGERLAVAEGMFGELPPLMPGRASDELLAEKRLAREERRVVRRSGLPGSEGGGDTTAERNAWDAQQTCS